MIHSLHVPSGSDLRQPADELFKFRVTAFDVVTSFLTALMLLLGAAVLMLLLLWMIDSQQPVAVIDPPSVRRVSTYHPFGLERDFLEPGAVEVEHLREVSIEATLLAVTDAASRLAGSETAFETVTSPRHGENGLGDSRPPGPVNVGGEIPAFDRWQMRFQARSLNAYARQLDHHGIELAAVGGGIAGVDYVRNLSAASPVKRRGPGEEEKRIYFLWNQPGSAQAGAQPLLAYDRRLLGVAGVEVEGRLVIKFIPARLEKRLARIELEYARAHGHQAIAEIAQTVFQSVPSRDGYRFEVIVQRYRKPGS